MGDMMTFPATVEEFMEQYKITDTEQVYSNGTEFVPIYRMRQWFDHVIQNGSSAVQHGRWEKWNGDNRHHCTVCECYANAERDAYGYITSEFLDNYCPNCGAIMATE